MEPPRAEHFPLFDALRGLAALLVFAYHGLYQFAVRADAGEWWWRYAIHFDVAVPIFFGISGFLLYRPFAAARAAGRTPSLRRYAIRRAARIVPAYWVWLTVITVWLGLPGVFTPEGVLTYYGFAQIYRPETALGGIGQAWTLNVEVTFYALLPVWALLVRRLALRDGRELAALVGLLLLSQAYKAVVLIGPAEPSMIEGLHLLFFLPGYVDMLAAGMAIGALSVSGRVPRAWSQRPGLMWVVAWAFWLGACAVGPSGRPEDPVDEATYAARHLLYVGFVFFLLLPAAFGDPRAGAVRRLLRWRPLAFLGTISYSFYLVHLAVIVQLAKWLGRAPDGLHEWALWTAAALAGSVALGTLGFRLVEKPAMDRSRHLGGRSAVAAAHARAAP